MMRTLLISVRKPRLIKKEDLTVLRNALAKTAKGLGYDEVSITGLGPVGRA